MSSKNGAVTKRSKAMSEINSTRPDVSASHSTRVVNNTQNHRFCLKSFWMIAIGSISILVIVFSYSVQMFFGNEGAEIFERREPWFNPWFKPNPRVELKTPENTYADKGTLFTTHKDFIILQLKEKRLKGDTCLFLSTPKPSTKILLDKAWNWEDKTNHLNLKRNKLDTLVLTWSSISYLLPKVDLTTYLITYYDADGEDEAYETFEFMTWVMIKDNVYYWLLCYFLNGYNSNLNLN